MPSLARMQQIVYAASTVSEFVSEVTHKSQTFRFHAPSSIGLPITCYTHIAHAGVKVHRCSQDAVEIHASLQAPLAWRVATEQDEAGVYFIALRRQIIGGFGRAMFTLTIPYHVHLILRMEDAMLTLDSVSATLALNARSTHADEEVPLSISTIG